jgi:hypothetical protein
MNLPQSGVPARAASNNLRLLERGELGGRDLHLFEEDAAGLPANAPGWYRGRARLLKDFLEHERW